ncbi:MAG: hypothetical protein LWY06_03875 [Firmicutes bacterium]|nr:hypothetical protein [Bacillota bacterium]
MKTHTKINAGIKAAVLAVLAFLFTAQAVFAADLPVYKDSPRDIVIQMFTAGGYAPEIVEKTRVPDFTLYGDGRVIYSRSTDPTNYKLYEAKLTPERMNALINLFEQEGFFDMNDNYLNVNVKDLPSAYVTLNLREKNRTIKIYGLIIATQQRLIPRGLINITRRLGEFTADGEKEFEPEKISIFVQELPKDQYSKEMKKVKWKVKGVELAKLAPEGASLLARYKETVLSGDERKHALDLLRGKTLFDNQVGFHQTVFENARRYFKVAYRPHLPYEQQ